MKNPTMIYKAPGPHEIHGGRFDYLIVDADEEGELEQAVADGWHLTTTAALEALKPADDNAPPTRNELIAKAKELGIKFDKKTTDAELSAAITAALAKE